MYELPCGCKFETLSDDKKRNDGLPPIKLDFYDLPDCHLVWDLFAKGDTTGVFQCEGSLGKHWSKEVQPKEVEDISAIVSVIRPGCLEAKIDGVSVTQRFANRNRGEEEPVPMHPAIEPILRDTNGLLIYQEQIMRICQAIAGFDLTKADIIRKAVGTKDPKMMAEIKKEFITGCERVGVVSPEDAAMIFDNIEKSQRYLFNKSHSVSYSYLSYATAYMKVHFPHQFFTAWLEFANEKIDPKKEVATLCENAEQNHVHIAGPSIRTVMNGDPGHFSLTDNLVSFGILNVKGVGNSRVESLIPAIVEKQIKLGNKHLDDFTWEDFLFEISPLTTKTVVVNLISAGFLPFNMSRKRMVFEYKCLSELTNREQEFVLSQTGNLYTRIRSLIAEGQINGRKLTAKRVNSLTEILDKLDSPAYSLDDTPEWIARSEKELLGLNLTCSILDSVDASGDTTVKEFLDGKPGKCSFVAEIKDAREYIIKQGRNAGNKMYFLTLSDSTGSMDAVVWTNILKKCENVIFEDNTVFVEGQRSKDKSSLVVSNMLQL